MFRNITYFTAQTKMDFSSLSRLFSLIFIEFLWLFLGFSGGGLCFLYVDPIAGYTVWGIIGILTIIYPFIYPQVYKKTQRALDAKNPLQDENVVFHYVFTEEGFSVAASRFGATISTTSLPYPALYRVVYRRIKGKPAREYLFLYIGAAQALIVFKDGMTEGDFYELVRLIKARTGAKFAARPKNSLR
jgi:hypothetical protein